MPVVSPVESFLADFGRRTLHVTDAPPGVAPIGLYLARPGINVEVALFEAGHRPRAEEVRTSWRLQHAGRAASVLAVVVYTGLDNAPAAACFGPQESGSVRHLPLSLVERYVAQALDAATRRMAEDAISELLGTDDDEDGVVGLRNEGLFSTHELIVNIPADAERWGQAQREATRVHGLTGEDLLRALGWSLMPHGGDILLTAGDRERALAVLLAGDEVFDRPSLHRGLGTSPVEHALNAARVRNLTWVLVVQGARVRLYSAQPDVGLARRGAATYVELDLALLAGTDRLGYAWLLLAPEALGEAGGIQRILADSADHATGVGERLRERIYDHVVPPLAGEVARAAMDLTEAGLSRAYHVTLVALFRVLFVAYAEDAGLLPYRTNAVYARQSLKSMARELADRDGTGSGGVLVGADFDEESTDLWDRLRRLWRGVSRGHTEWGVPAYGGSLFRDDGPAGEVLASVRLTNRQVGPALAAMLVDVVSGSDGTVRGPVDFHDLSVREFGTIYEGLLESSLSLALVDLALGKDNAYVPAAPGQVPVVSAGSVYFHNSSGARKATGSYFTKQFAVEHLLRTALDPTIDEHLMRVLEMLDAGRQSDAARAFFTFRVADISMGSGHFLVGAVDHIAAKLSAFLDQHPIPQVQDELDRLRASAVAELDENGNESAALTKTFTTPGNPATTALSTTYPQTYDDWEEGLLAGDGKQGIIVFGNPRAETVVFDDRDFFMARKEDRAHRTFNTVSEENIKKIRDLLIGGAYQEANQLAADVQGWQDGGEGSKHPGFKMTIDIPDSGEISNYVRSTDYASGVVSVDWADDKGEWERESFVSSTDGATVQYLPAPAGQTLDATFGLSIDPGMNLLNKGLTAVNNSNTDYLNLRVKYPNGSFDAGYEGVTRIVTDGVKTMDGTDVSVTGATYVLLVSLTQRYDGTYEGGNPAEQEWDKELLQAKLAAMPDDYETLRDRHVSKHSEIFNRVSIDFAASDEDRSKSNEQLLAEQKASMTPIPALFERMFYSGRYHLLASSSATAPPDLLGNWTGDSNVGWDGYYHLDANLNLQISSGNIGNMPEVMEGYFNLNKEWQEDFRTNARKLLGTRGMLTGGNTPNGEGLISNINFDYPYQYVTGGESWLLYPFWEQYMVTGDKTFLEEEYYPLIRDMGDFYEDFLVEKDENGDYIFAGSISPENRPAGGVPLSVNSVYDIAGARFALSTLIETSEVLGKDQDKIAVWQELLDNLPPYLINNDGAIAEWAWPDLANKNAYQHRHSSALMPVWPYREVTPEKDQALYDAAKVFLQKKDEGNYENAGHGLAHAALIAANLNNAPSVNAKLLRFAKDDYYYSSLATSHYNNHGVFATDVVNSVPTIMMEMLATTDPGTLELLPALPEAMKQGSISGMLGKSQFTIDNLDWDMDARKVSVTVTSQIDQDLTLIQREGIETISSDDIAIESSPLGDIARVLPLQKDETVTIELTLTDASRVNLALDRPAVASSESNAQQTAAKAFDGDPTTSWGASESADNWLQVDLGEVYDLNEVVLQWEASYAKGYKLQASMDGVSWKDIYTQSDSSGGRESIPVDALGRYVRMQGTEKSGELGYSLYEMEVYGQEAPNIALGKPATASGSRQSRVSAGQQQFDRSVWVAGVMSGRCGDAGFPGQA